MKLAKLISALLTAAVVASAAVPMASAEAADFDINGKEFFFIADEETTPLTFGEDGSMTMTIAAKAEGVNSGCMMWTNVADKFVDLSQTPYLCWDISGTGKFGLSIRWDENDGTDLTCYRMHKARGHEADGLDPEKGSMNFLDMLKNNDLDIVYNGDEIMMIAVAINVFGDVGDSITFNKLYFSASPLGEVQPGGTTKDPDATTDTTPAPTTTTQTDSTTTAPTTTLAPTSSTTAPAVSQNNANSALIVLAIAIAVVLIAAVVVVILVRKKKKN